MATVVRASRYELMSSTKYSSETADRFVAEEKVPSAHLERQAELLLAEGYGGFFSVEVINPPDGDPVLQSHAAVWEELRGQLGF